MKLAIHGKNIKITDSIREYVHQKIQDEINVIYERNLGEYGVIQPRNKQQ